MSEPVSLRPLQICAPPNLSPLSRAYFPCPLVLLLLALLLLLPAPPAPPVVVAVVVTRRGGVRCVTGLIFSPNERDTVPLDFARSLYEAVEWSGQRLILAWLDKGKMLNTVA